jgi:hypothetical protein
MANLRFPAYWVVFQVKKSRNCPQGASAGDVKAVVTGEFRKSRSTKWVFCRASQYDETLRSPLDVQPPRVQMFQSRQNQLAQHSRTCQAGRPTFSFPKRVTRLERTGRRACHIRNQPREVFSETPVSAFAFHCALLLYAGAMLPLGGPVREFRLLICETQLW